MYQKQNEDDVETARQFRRARVMRSLGATSAQMAAAVPSGVSRFADLVYGEPPAEFPDQPPVSGEVDWR